MPYLTLLFWCPTSFMKADQSHRLWKRSKSATRRFWPVLTMRKSLSSDNSMPVEDSLKLSANWGQDVKYFTASSRMCGSRGSKQLRIKLNCSCKHIWFFDSTCFDALSRISWRIGLKCFTTKGAKPATVTKWVNWLSSPCLSCEDHSCKR